MDIYLSINNREKVVQIPVLPPEFTVGSPQLNEIYSAVAGDLNIIGKLGLKTIGWSSFFPVGKSSYNKNQSMFDWEFVSELEKMRKSKMPFRLVITDTPINMPVTIDNFEYGLKNGPKNVWYSIGLREFTI